MRATDLWLYVAPSLGIDVFGSSFYLYIFYYFFFNLLGLWSYLNTTCFNIQQFYDLPTQCIYVFCVDLRTNSDYFPIQH
jgi:hypothetical protein